VPGALPSCPEIHDALQGVLAEVLAAASRILGAPVAENQSLMEAGLDSLGGSSFDVACCLYMCGTSWAVRGHKQPLPFMCNAACCSGIGLTRHIVMLRELGVRSDLQHYSEL
jgi:hypothetical protein